MGKKGRRKNEKKQQKQQQQTQQPKEPALAPNVPAERITHKNVVPAEGITAEQEVHATLMPQGHTVKNSMDSDKEVESKAGNQQMSIEEVKEATKKMVIKKNLMDVPPPTVSFEPSEVEDVQDPQETGTATADQMEDKGSHIIKGLKNLGNLAAVPMVSSVAQHSRGGGTEAQTRVEKAEYQQQQIKTKDLSGVEKAKLKAFCEGKWLIISLQSSSHMLNPDIWGSESISDFVKLKFFFWEVACETKEGRKTCMEYNLQSNLLPAILLIDSSTGEVVKRWYNVETALAEDILPVLVDIKPLQRTSSVCKEASFFTEQDNEPRLRYPPLPEEPQEPLQPYEEHDIFNIEIRLPSGRRVRRKFLSIDPIKLLWSFAYHNIDNGDRREFHFVQIGVEKCRHLYFRSDKNFKDAQINSTLNLVWD